MVRRATSQDVADRAGVSRSAVSTVLNGRGAGNISADTQAAIRAAAADLDYTPNSVAVSLRSRRTRTLGVVTDAIASGGFAGRLLQGASAAAEAAGHVLVLVDVHGDPAGEPAAYRTLLDRRVDALVFAAMALREYTVPREFSRVPAALANCFDPTDPVPAFVPAEVEGGRTAVRLLLAAGHRRIAMLSGHAGDVAAVQREEGFALETAAAGLLAPAPVAAGWEIDRGVLAATAVLASAQRPTGLVCANDRVATGAVLAAARLGLDVPGDVSVVGYDDDQNLAPSMVPGLTTVALPHREMGERAVLSVLAQLAGQAPDLRRTALPCLPVLRGSVGPPPV